MQDKAKEIFLFSFPGRVPVIFHWISKGFVTVLLLKKYLASKIEKKRSTSVFLRFYEPADLGNKFPQPEMLLSQKYI